MPLLDWSSEATVLENVIHSNTVYFNVLFPSEHRYYFEFIRGIQNPILLDHPSRLYFPQTISVGWAYPDGIYITLWNDPEFVPFERLEVRIYIPQIIYDAMITAMENPINSSADLVPSPSENTSGVVEFILLSTDAGEQIKIDLVNTSYVPEIPVTVRTLQWNEVLYYVMSLYPNSLPSLPPLLPPPPTFNFPNTSYWGSIVFGAVPWNDSTPKLDIIPPVEGGSFNFEFAYTIDGDLGITFIDPRYCFLREWITFPPEWTNAIKEFSGV